MRLLDDRVIVDHRPLHLVREAQSHCAVSSVGPKSSKHRAPRGTLTAPAFHPILARKMPARTGKQFLECLRRTARQLWVEGERVDDVTTHPALAGAAQTIAGVFDRQHAFPDDCLTPIPRPASRSTSGT